jgi:transposase-like protein
LVKNGKKIFRRISVREITIEKVQQWKCTACKASFTFRKSKGKRTQYTEAFIKETVSDFVMGGSYRRIQERREVSIGTLSVWIHTYGEHCMSPVEIAEYLHLREQNKWSGILLLDGKYLNSHMVLLLAVDYRTQDIVSWRIAENESQDNYKKLITDVQNCGYIIKALISDGGTGIRALTQKRKPSFIRIGSRPYPRPGVSPAKEHTVFLPNIPHQWCVVHAQRELLKYVRTKAKKEEREILTVLINQILFSSTLAQAECQVPILLNDLSKSLFIQTTKLNG